MNKLKKSDEELIKELFAKLDEFNLLAKEAVKRKMELTFEKETADGEIVLKKITKTFFS